MVCKIKVSTCIDRHENGLMHAMDMLSHHRRHNLTEEKYNEIRSLIGGETERDHVKITEKDQQINMVLISRSADEFNDFFNEYGELFNKIDNMID